MTRRERPVLVASSSMRTIRPCGAGGGGEVPAVPTARLPAAWRGVLRPCSTRGVGGLQRGWCGRPAARMMWGTRALWCGAGAEAYRRANDEARGEVELVDEISDDHALEAVLLAEVDGAGLHDVEQLAHLLRAGVGVR